MEKLYTELDIINNLNSNKKKELLLIFHEEYSGWFQHLKSVGASWGNAGEAVGAYKESLKCREHLDKIKLEILKMKI